MDPIVEDTRGIDRGSHRTPGGIFPWLYLQAQRYLPVIRLRVLPGLITRANAEPWLTWVTFTVPWLALGALAMLVVGRGGAGERGHADAAFVATLAVLSLVTYQTLVRASPDSRLGDVAAVTVVLLAWLAWRAWMLPGWTGAAAKIAAVLLVTLTFSSAMVYGRVVSRLGDAGVDGPVNLVRRAGGQFTLFGGHPLDLYAPPGTRGLAGLSRWLNQCTREGDRVSVIGFEPQVFVLAQRGFAGGLAFYDLGWNSSDRDQRLAIERWSGQQVPIVLAMSSEWESFSRDYPSIRAFIDARYEAVQRSAFGGGKELTVLANRASVRVGTHAAMELPCFR
jgi:hypothetical protein